MNIMNKLYKCALGLLTTLVLSCSCFSSAINIPSTSWNGNTNDTPFDDYLLYRRENVTYNGSNTINVSEDYDFICMRVGSSNNSSCKFSLNQSNWYSFADTSLGCLNTHTFYVQGTSCSFSAYFFKETDDIMPLPMTSLECQTEYSLIPISEITANYCKLNFDLIDPMECPINEGTGTIVRSNLTINNTPYAQNQNINVYIPDFLAWNVAFNDFNTVIEVEGYNADESYIENVINNEKLTPTNKDFEQMLTGFMTNYFPYLALALIFLYLARKIFKLFK